MTSKTLWIPALIAGVALVGGIAWAAQSQSINLPSASAFIVRAEIVPGDAGEVLYIGTREGGWVDEEDLKVDFDPSSGDLLVFGNVVGTFNDEHAHSVDAYFRDTSAGWTCDVTVRDLDDDLTLHQGYGYEYTDEPVSCTATGETVLSLTAE